MPLYQTPAIVFRSTPYGESDRIVTLYTLDFGKIKGIAKGAKRSQKRFANTLEIGSYIQVVFFEKETQDLVRLDHSELIHPFGSLREDIIKLAWASYFIELVNEMTAEKIKNKALFRLLVFFLNLIDQGMLQEETQRVFEVRLLSHLGYQPHFDHCTSLSEASFRAKNVSSASGKEGCSARLVRPISPASSRFLWGPLRRSSSPSPFPSKK